MIRMATVLKPFPRARIGSVFQYAGPLRVFGVFALMCLTAACGVQIVLAQSARQVSTTRPAPLARPAPAVDVLTPVEWRTLDQSVNRALGWLATRQSRDGSIEANPRAQPAATALAVMGYLSCGHVPGAGRYGDVINRAVAYVISCQQPDGILAHDELADYMRGSGSPEHAACYDHAIGGLMLTEVFGMTGGERSGQLGKAIERAIACTLRLQNSPPKRFPVDKGGWRYVRPWEGSDSDLSLTSWQLMFLRSARNAGFSVPSDPIDKAMAYVDRCAMPDGSFNYGLAQMDRHVSVAMVGAGILSMSLGGRHQTPVARKGGDWILAHTVERTFGDYRFFYNAFYATQGMHQLGGDHWSRFYPKIMKTLTSNQNPDGSWPPEPGEEWWGESISTSFAAMTLGTPYELLPIFQR